MRGALLLALLLAVPLASSLSVPREPVLSPLTLHAHFLDGDGALGREATPDPWRLEPDRCLGTDRARFVVSSGAPVLRGGGLEWTGDRGLSGPLPVGTDSVLHWVVARPAGVPVEVAVEATLYGVLDEFILNTHRTVILEPGDATHAGSVDGMDVHHVELAFDGDDRTVLLPRTTLLEVSVSSNACLARHHSSPGHRPTWDLPAGSPLQVDSLEHHDGAFRAWVGSAWGPDDLVLGDLRLETGDEGRLVAPAPLSPQPVCHCANDSYQYLVQWEAPEPDGSWVASIHVGSRTHPGTARLTAYREADLDAEAPGLGWGLLPLLVAIAGARRR